MLNYSPLEDRGYVLVSTPKINNRAFESKIHIMDHDVYH